MIPFRESIQERARELQRIIVFPEGQDERTLDAAARLQIAGLVHPLVLGDPENVRSAVRRFGGDPDGIEVVDHTKDPRFELFVRELHELRAPKGWSEEDAREKMRDPLVFAAALVRGRHVHGSVAGASRTTGDVLRAALWMVGTAPGIRTVSASFYMIVPSFRDTNAREVLTFTDASVVPDPDADQLADIAAAAAVARRQIVGDEPRVAFLSYSTHGSASGPSVDRIRNALARFRELIPGVMADGELQVDAALIPEVARRKTTDSLLAGRANVLVFPDLDSGNIGYKLVQRLAHADAVGPILQGLARPCNDLSRGASADDIVAVACVTALQE
ncbi:MAG TPA: phosphate acetyltransferase [Longimicrobiales bacterium]|nr:phosphate acetyltransferase [Longimicrobiales bacterium]